MCTDKGNEFILFTVVVLAVHSHTSKKEENTSIVISALIFQSYNTSNDCFKFNESHFKVVR